MGGHAGGQIAAQLAIESFQNNFLAEQSSTIDQRLHNSLMAANARLKTQIDMVSELDGMGCTLVAAILRKECDLHWISVGDSHLYRFGPSRLSKLNADHSMAPQIDQQEASGEITAEQSRNHPNRNVLVSALTGNRIALIDQGNCKIAEHSQVMLATDGLDTLLPSEISQAIEQSKNPTKAIREILSKIQNQMLPDQDNTAIILTDRQQLKMTASREQKPLFSSRVLILLIIIGTAIVSSALTWGLIDPRSKVDDDLEQTAPISASPVAKPKEATSDRIVRPERSKLDKDSINSANVAQSSGNMPDSPTKPVPSQKFNQKTTKKTVPQKGLTPKSAEPVVKSTDNIEATDPVKPENLLPPSFTQSD
mgnify:CR=1 FL=1